MSSTISTRVTSWLLAAVVSLALVFAIPALDPAARAAGISNGRLHNFTYDTDTHRGHFALINHNGTKHYKVNKDTECGYTTGQSGGPMPCRNLRNDKYENSKTRVTWKQTNSGRRALQVVVDIS